MPRPAFVLPCALAAARASWDRPQRKTERLRVTLPDALAKALRAAADKAGLSLSDYAERLLATALADAAAAPAAPQGRSCIS